MESIKITLFILIWVCAFGCQAPTPQTVALEPPATPRENPYLQQLLADYQYFIDSTLSATQTPGAAVAIVKDSSIIYLKGFGLRSSDQPDSVDTHSVFRIASVSKSFAGFLTGLMVEDGVLAWQDKVVQHLPNFSLQDSVQTQKLNLSHVLSHTTGLPYHTYTTLVEDHQELGEMLGKLSQIKLISEVGQLYSYQNVAYSLIGQVLQEATGKPYQQLMREEVFEPLGMNDASLSYDQMVENPNIAFPHSYGKDQWVPSEITDTYYNVAPAGGINASISDMAQWLTVLTGSKTDFISKATMGQLFRPLVKTPVRNRYFGRWLEIKEAYYGLGFRILNFDQRLVAYHGGFVNGYRCEMAIYPSEKIAICVMTNAPTELANQSVPNFLNLYKKYQASIDYWEKQATARQMLPLEKGTDLRDPTHP